MRRGAATAGRRWSCVGSQCVVGRGLVVSAPPRHTGSAERWSTRVGRRLEPVYEEVADSLVVQGINVARIDGSKFKGVRHLEETIHIVASAGQRTQAWWRARIGAKLTTWLVLVHAAVGARFGVQGFPTIMHVHNKEVRRHEGQRSKDALTSFALDGWKGQAEDLTSPIGTSPFSSSAKALGTALEFAVFLQVRVLFSLSLWVCPAALLSSLPPSLSADLPAHRCICLLLLQDRYDYVRETYKLSHPFLLALLGLVMIIVGSLWGMLLSVLLPPGVVRLPAPLLP